MATGSLFDSSNINLLVYSPIDCSSLGVVANGYLNIYNDDDPNCFDKYCEYFYCCSGYVYPENSGFNCINNISDATGFLNYTAKSDGIGGYFWDKTYYSGTLISFTTGNCGYYDLEFCSFFENGSNNWFNSSISSDGLIQAVVPICGYIYLSLDSGINFQPIETVRDWRSIAVSKNGNLISAVSCTQGVFISLDSGNNFIQTVCQDYKLYDISISCDGCIQSAIGNPGYIYVSNDSGNSWIQKENERSWTSIKISNDGSIQAAVTFDGDIFISLDTGNSWEARETGYQIINYTGEYVNLNNFYVDTGNLYEVIQFTYDRKYTDISISDDGKVIAAIDYNCGLYVSTDSGFNWENRFNKNGCWSSVSISCNGAVQTIAEYNGNIYFSSDTGLNWKTLNYSGNWQTISLSSNGCTQLIADYNNKINKFIYCEDSDFFNLTGFYCCSLYSNGVDCGFFYKKIPYSGIELYSSGNYVNICGDYFENGGFKILTNGCGSSFCLTKYCDYGYAFLSFDNYQYISDNNGSFIFSERVPRIVRNVCFGMDFSAETKSKYNFTTINACGNSICLSFKENSINFYEINSICDTTICILEANINSSIFINEVKKPFLYIKNIGENILNIKLANNFLFENFKQCQIYLKNQYCNKNACIFKNEFIFITLNVSSDGSSYFSNFYYPFGFFYEFKQIALFNQFGFNPVCCAFDSINNCCFPIFTYSSICNLPILNCEVDQSDYGFNYTKQLAYSENLKVDNLVDLEISLFKQTGNLESDIFYISKNFDIISNYGINCFISKVQTNCVYLLTDIECCLLGENDIFSKNITSNTSLCLIYDVDFINEKKYNLIYLDCNSGISDYDFVIKKISESGISCFDRQYVCSQGAIIELKEDEQPYVEIFLGENAVIKNLSNSEVNRSNLFLPKLQDFNYNYCFSLRPSFFIDNKSLTGYWCSSIHCSGEFCNCSFIIDACSEEYNLYKSKIYNINICNFESEKNSCCISNKCNFNVTEDFCIIYSINECSYFYCCLEFKFFPIEKIIHNNYIHDVNSFTTGINFFKSGVNKVIDFPISAVSIDKLKIISTFNIKDLLCESNLNIKYEDFNLKILCKDSSYLTYNIPIIQNENLTGYEYPELTICNKNKNEIQLKKSFYINPASNIGVDNFYGLNDFLFFLNSELNSGIALDFINCSQKNLSDYSYSSEEYSFLMMELKNEFNNSNLPKIQSNWIKFNEQFVCENASNFISYKNNTGNGYNYIYPVISKICYIDEYTINNEIKCASIIETGFFNYSKCCFAYQGSSIEYFYLTGSCGEIISSGYCTGNCAIFCMANPCSLIKLSKNDLTGSIASRNILIKKDYDFTGIQPFYIETNYNLLSISNFILDTGFNEYSCAKLSGNNLFYYLYDINEPVNKKIKLTSPDLTCFFNLEFDTKNSTFANQNLNFASIKNNFAIVDLNICSFIYENSYLLNTGEFKKLNINIIGGL